MSSVLLFQPLIFTVYCCVFLKVRDETSKSLGYLSMPLSDLLTADCFTVDGWFPLNSSEAEILMRAQLRVSG